MSSTSSSSDPLAALYDAAGHLRSLSPTNTPPPAASLVTGRPSYEFLISSVKGPDSVKSFCAEFLPDFIHWFPQLADLAFSAQLDLIEDEKVDIRKRAVRGLEKLCKNSPNYVGKSTDVLGQLLIGEDAAELTLVRKTFAALIDLGPTAAFAAIFNLIRDGQTEAAVRAKAIEFLKLQMERCRTLIRGPKEEKKKEKKDKGKKTNAAAGAGQPPSAKGAAVEEKKEEAVPVPPLQSTILVGVESLLSLSDLPPSDFTLFLKYLLSFKTWREEEANKKKLQSLLESVGGIHKTIPKDSASAVGTADAQLTSFLSVFRSLPAYKKYDIQVLPFLNFLFHTVWPRLTTGKEGDNPHVDNVFSVKSKLSLLRAAVLSPLFSNNESVDNKYVRSVLSTLWTSLSTWMNKIPEIPKSQFHSTDEKKKEEVNRECLYSVTPSETLCRDYFSVVEAVLALLHVLFHLDTVAALSICGIGNIAGQPLDSATEARKAVTVKLLASIQEATTNWSKNVADELKEIGKETKAITPSKAEQKDESEEKKTDRKEKYAKLRERKGYLSSAKKLHSSIEHLISSLVNKTPSFKSKAELKLSFGGGKTEKENEKEKKKGRKGQKGEKGKKGEKGEKGKGKGKGTEQKKGSSNKKDGKEKEKNKKGKKGVNGNNNNNNNNNNNSNKGSNKGSNKRGREAEPQQGGKRRKTQQSQGGQQSRNQSQERKGKGSDNGQSSKKRKQSGDFSSNNPLIQLAIEQQRASQHLQMQMLQSMLQQNPQYASLMGMGGRQQQQPKQQQRQQQGGGGGGGRGGGQRQKNKGQNNNQQQSRKRRNN